MKPENTSIRLKRIMNERGLKQVDILELAKPYCIKLGTKLNKNDLSQYVSGKVEPGSHKLTILGLALDVSEAWLMGYDVPISRQAFDRSNINDIALSAIQNIGPMPNFVKKPRLGTIACGEPILAVENIEEYDNVPEDIKCDFTLKCKGDSMVDARINDGDIVYIKQQPTVENGQIAAVLIEDEATLKRVYLSDNTITLLACNPRYQPFVYSGEQLNQIKILGKAVGFTSII